MTIETLVALKPLFYAVASFFTFLKAWVDSWHQGPTDKNRRKDS